MLKKLIMGGIISALFTAVALPAFASAQCPSNGGSMTPIVIAQNQGCSNTGSSNDIISKILSSLNNGSNGQAVNLSGLKNLSCSNTGNNAGCNGISPQILNALKNACGSNPNCLSALRNLCSNPQGCNINGINLSSCNSR